MKNFCFILHENPKVNPRETRGKPEESLRELLTVGKEGIR
jgi:hypothetical protein